MRLQGCGKHALAVRKDDLYETPPEAVRALLRHVRLPDPIWEPACGPGAIVKELRAAGHEVVATDLVDYGARRCPDSESGRDFLLELAAPPGCATIVTNPPFKLADDFIRHGLRLVPTVIVLLRLAALEGVGRSDIIDGHLREVLLGKERLPRMHRGGWTGPKAHGGSGAPFAWFVFCREPSDRGILLRRISWRDPAVTKAA